MVADGTNAVGDAPWVGVVLGKFELVLGYDVRVLVEHYEAGRAGQLLRLSAGRSFTSQKD